MTGAGEGGGRGRVRRGFTVVELMVVLTLMGVMTAMAAPSFRRAVEVANADIAVANLRGVWAAQRVYWIAHREYAADLRTLVDLDLLNPEVLAAAAASAPYAYAVEAADPTTFTVRATRNRPSAYAGSFTIDQTGAVGNSVVKAGDPSEPPIAPPSNQ